MGVVLILALTQFTVVLDFMVMNPIGDLLMKSMKISPAQFSVVVSVYAFSAAISGFLTAGFADKFDRKKLLVFFYIGFILGTLLCGLVNSYALLVVARIVTGIFGGVISSISMAIVVDLFQLNQRGRVMGFLQMGFGISQILGIPLSLYIANDWGWQSPFFMIVGLAMVIAFIGIIFLKPVTEHLSMQSGNALIHLWNTIKNKDYRIAFLATAFLSIGGFLMMPWGSAFAMNNLEITKQQLPILFMIAGISTLAIMPVIGIISDKINKFTLFTIASLWMMVTVLVYTHLVPLPFWIIVGVNILMMIGIMSRMVPSQALTSSVPDMKDRGAFMSVNSSLQQMAGGLAAILGGMIVVQKNEFSPLEHFDTLGYVVLAAILINIFLTYRVSKMVDKRQQKSQQ
ncbi:MAG: transporter [Crocinitomicaceae bacterium]|nr:transporter [Crocinitomicaceae bacterium]